MQISKKLTTGQLSGFPRTKLSVAGVGVVATAVILLALFIAIFANIQYATAGLLGNDGYYHIKMGYLIRQQGLKLAFDALPLTILNPEAFYDHHFLYHVYLAIFATVNPAVDGGLALTRSAKIASIILPAISFLAIWWLMRAQGVRWAAVWAIGLFAISEAFLYRMSMPRAQALSLLLLVLAVHWLLQKKYWLLLPLGFVYVWAYNAFPLLLVVAGAYLFTILLLERRIVWQAILFPFLGISLGLLINPYFPENISFITSHLLPKIGESATKVGNEWSPYKTWTLVENSGLALAAVFLGVIALGWHKERMDKNTLFVLILTLLFGYMLFKSRRFVEYFPPFALIFLAFAIRPLLENWLQKVPTKQIKYLSLIPILMLGLLMYPLFVSIQDTRDLVDNSKPATRYADAALWLRAQTEPGTMIFQTDWDDFTRLYFYNSDAVYTAGLDPTFFELENPELFNEWVDITKGRIENPGAQIRDRFNADYVFSDLNHKSFLKMAKEDPLLTEIYQDDDAIIFAVLD